MTSISIIILHYNTVEFTTECLRSLEKANFKDIKVNVVVVDNASDEHFTFHSDVLSVTTLRNDMNTGFSGGNNTGMNYALATFNPDYILLLNSDTLVDVEFLQKLIVCAKEKRKAGAICPKIYFEHGYEFHKEIYASKDLGKVLWFAGGSLDWKNMLAFHRGVDEVDRGQCEKTRQDPEKKTVPHISYQTMDFATGCCMLIPKQVIKEVGMFDESYFLYWEDTDWSVRMKQAGYELYFCPESIIWHKNAGSTGGSGTSAQVNYQKRNRVKFAMKYAPLRTKIAILKGKLLVKL